MKKVLGVALIVVLLLNLIFFGLGKIDWKVFWLIIAIAAAAAYWILPKMNTYIIQAKR